VLLTIHQVTHPESCPVWQVQDEFSIESPVVPRTICDRGTQILPGVCSNEVVQIRRLVRRHSIQLITESMQSIADTLARRRENTVFGES